jgi:hypothetical protein
VDGQAGVVGQFQQRREGSPSNISYDTNIEVGLLVQSSVLSERLSRFFEALVDNHYFRRAI